MRIEHPDAVEGEAVDYGDGYALVGDDGIFEVPDDAESWLRRWCDANGYDREAVVVDGDGADAGDAGTCQEVKNDGEVCGRDLPCQYHSED